MKRYLCLFLLLLAGTGCEQALFPINVPRSQYERFSYQRDGFTPQQEETAFSHDEIDLRSRLKPLSER